MASNLNLNPATAPKSVPSPNAALTTTITVSPDTMNHPFIEINKPFYAAAADPDPSAAGCFQKGHIKVDKFIAAISAFLKVFDALNQPIITEIVRKDIRWKTNGLRGAAKRLRADTLHDLVQKELKSPPRFWAPSGIESLLWSHRILRFVEQLVAHMVDDSALELKDACIRSYRSTLASRHPPMTKSIFERALSFVPSRAEFFRNLAQRQDESPSEDHLSRCLVGMNEFLRVTRPIIGAMSTMFDLEQIEDPHR